MNDAERRVLSATLMGPGICLILIGILGILLSGGATLFFQSMKEELTDQILRDWNRQNPGQPPPPRETVFAVLKSFSVVHMISAAASLVVLLSGFMILTRRGYGLAISGSILAMINFGACLCILGLPIGIWSLIMLCRPGVSQLFR